MTRKEISTLSLPVMVNDTKSTGQGRVLAGGSDTQVKVIGSSHVSIFGVKGVLLLVTAVDLQQNIVYLQP